MSRIIKKKNEPVKVGEIVDAINSLDYVVKKNQVILNCLMYHFGLPPEFIEDVHKPEKDLRIIAEKFGKLELKESLTISGKTMAKDLQI
jgi:hypothetical protein